MVMGTLQLLITVELLIETYALLEGTPTNLGGTNGGSLADGVAASPGVAEQVAKRETGDIAEVDKEVVEPLMRKAREAWPEKCTDCFNKNQPPQDPEKNKDEFCSKVKSLLKCYTENGDGDGCKTANRDNFQTALDKKCPKEGAATDNATTNVPSTIGLVMSLLVACFIITFP